MDLLVPGQSWMYSKIPYQRKKTKTKIPGINLEDEINGDGLGVARTWK